MFTWMSVIGNDSNTDVLYVMSCDSDTDIQVSGGIRGPTWSL